MVGDRYLQDWVDRTLLGSSLLASGKDSTSGNFTRAEEGTIGVEVGPCGFLVPASTAQALSKLGEMLGTSTSSRSGTS